MLCFAGVCQGKSICSCRLLTTFGWRNIGHEGRHFGEFSKQAKARGFKVASNIASNQRNREIQKFRETEQLVVYQLLPNLAVWENFGWLSSGSEPASMWGPLHDIHIKSRVLVTIAIFRVSWFYYFINWFYYYRDWCLLYFSVTCL